MNKFCAITTTEDDDKKYGPTMTRILGRVKSGGEAIKSATTSKMSIGDKVKSVYNSIKGNLDNNKNYGIQTEYRRAFRSADINARREVSFKQVNHVNKFIEGDENLSNRLTNYYIFEGANKLIQDGVAYENMPLWAEWRADESTKGQGVEEFEAFVKTNFDKLSVTIAEDSRTLSAVQSMNHFIENATKELNMTIGETGSHIAGSDAVRNMLSYASTNPQLKSYIEKTYNVSVDEINSNWILYKSVEVDMLKQATAKQRAFNETKKLDQSESFAEDFKSITSTVRELDAQTIKDLGDDNKLKAIFGEAEERFGKVDDLRVSGDYKDVSDINIIKDQLQKQKVSLLTNDIKLQSDETFARFVEGHSQMYPETYKMLTTNAELDGNKLVREVDNMIENYKEIKIFDTGLHDYKEAKANINMIDEGIREQVELKTDNVVQEVMKKYPGMVMTNSTGNVLIDVNGNYTDFADSKDIFKSVNGLMDEQAIMKNVADMAMLDMLGDDYLTGMINNGKIMVLPEADAKLMSQSKQDVMKAPSNIGSKVATTFRKWTLLNPLRLPAYQLKGTFGNVALTLMSDPTAFKHWPEQYLATARWFNGSFYDHYAPDSAEAKVFEATFEHSGSYGSVDLNEMGITPKVIGEFEKLANGSEGLSAKKITSEILRISGSSVQFRELGARTALAMSHYNRLAAGTETDRHMIGTNTSRVAAETDIYKKSAMIAHEQMLDYANQSALTRNINGNFLMFFSFVSANAKRQVKQFTGVYKNTKDNLAAGNYGEASKSALQGGISVALAMGISSLAWNGMMNLTGALDDDEYEKLQEKNNSWLTGNVGDSFIYVPGTGVDIIDNTLRIGTNDYGPVANTGMNLFETAADWLPFIDGTDPAEKLTSKFASSMNPLYKSAFEYAGGGTYWEDYGFVEDPEWDSKGSFRKLAETGAGFVGAKPETTSLFEHVHGETGAPRSEGAYDLQWLMSGIQDVQYENYDNESSKYTKAIADSMEALNADYTVSTIADYIRYLQSIGTEDSQIQSLVTSTVNRNTLFGVGNADARTQYYANLTDSQKERFIAALRTQTDFLTAIGITL